MVRLSRDVLVLKSTVRLPMLVFEPVDHASTIDEVRALINGVVSLYLLPVPTLLMVTPLSWNQDVRSFITVIFFSADAPLDASARIVAVPSLRGVTTPLSSTAATSGFDEVHVSVSVA